MNLIAPKHVSEYCIIDEHDEVFKELKHSLEDAFSYVYKIRCNCGNTRFLVYSDAHPSVYAKCSLCHKMIALYDLSYYPSAVKLDKKYSLEKVQKYPVLAYVNYEYDDEYLTEDDVDFDVNDITWAKVFINENGNIKKILDDETA